MNARRPLRPYERRLSIWLAFVSFIAALQGFTLFARSGAWVETDWQAIKALLGLGYVPVFAVIGVLAVHALLRGTRRP